VSQATLTEQEVRALRDRLYGVPTADDQWENCKANWMKPEEVQWLRDQLEEGK